MPSNTLTPNLEVLHSEYPLNAVETLDWFVLYTAPRAEKVAYTDLLSRGYDVFLPTIETIRVWKNRQKKKIDQVLFPGYLFIRTQQERLHDLCQLPKIVTFIRTGNKASVVPDKDITRVKQIIQSNNEISVESNLQEGELVRIVTGPFSGFEGKLIQRKGKSHFGISLHGINQTVLVEIAASSMIRLCKN